MARTGYNRKMKLHINEGAIKITEELEKRGYEAYVVGGQSATLYLKDQIRTGT